MFRKLTTVLLAVALAVSSGLKLPQTGISSISSSNVSGMNFSNASSVVDQHVRHRKLSDSPCQDIQLVFDLSATVQESTKFNKRYFDCPTPVPGLACFFYKDSLNILFNIQNIVSGQSERFMGRYTIKVVGGGPYSRANVRNYSDAEILHVNSFIERQYSQERAMWILRNTKIKVNYTKEGFSITRGLSNWLGFVCRKNSLCGDLTPKGVLSPNFFFIIEVSNEGVDDSTDCVLSTRFELHIHGFPILPDRALLYMGIMIVLILSLIGAFVAYNVRRQKQCEEHDSLSEEEDFEILEADGWTRLRKIHSALYNFIQTSLFRKFILCVVILDTTLMVLQAFPGILSRGGWVFSVLDICILGVYLVELLLMLMVFIHNYFRSIWNLIDFVLTIMSVLHFSLPLAEFIRIIYTPKIIKALRAVRAFRFLKVIRTFKTIQVLLTTLGKSLSLIGSTCFLMALVLIWFAVLFRVVYGEAVPESFQSYARAVSTLFQVLTLDDWALVYNSGDSKGYSHIMIPLALYIIIQNFIFLNMILAVLVDNLEMTTRRANQKVEATQNEENEEEFIRKIELDMNEKQPEEESHEETLRKRFDGQKYGERKAQLMAEYLRALATMEQLQFSIESDAFLLNKLLEIS